MKFVDRTAEQERFVKLLSKEEPGFAIVRGRRRVGKSTLVKKVLTDGDIYFEADRTDASTQMANFCYVAAHVFEGFDDVGNVLLPQDVIELCR